MGAFFSSVEHSARPENVHMFLCVTEDGLNYGYLVQYAENKCFAVDVPIGSQYNDEAAKMGWEITHILVTHWHHDHVGGIPEVLEAGKNHGRTIELIGPLAEKEQCISESKTQASDWTRWVTEGDSVKLGQYELKVMLLPGHTDGHIVFYKEGTAGSSFIVAGEDPWLFCGDVLFTLGCGRMFEGQEADKIEGYWTSMARLRDLPDTTLVFCAHEYTLASAAFAMSLDPENEALRAQVTTYRAQREAGKFTVPSTIGDEKAANPFMRPEEMAPILKNRCVAGGKECDALDSADKTDAAVFGKLRMLKNDFPIWCEDRAKSFLDKPKNNTRA